MCLFAGSSEHSGPELRLSPCVNILLGVGVTHSATSKNRSSNQHCLVYGDEASVTSDVHGSKEEG